jgi:hypothetical protein
MLSDFVVADRSEAGAIARSADHQSWPSFRSGDCTVFELGLLHFALTGEDTVTLSAYVDTFACLDDSDDWWLHELPASFVEELAGAGDLKAIAARWASFEELDGAPADSLADLLVELQRLSRLARQERKSLLLWTSL